MTNLHTIDITYMSTVCRLDIAYMSTLHTDQSQVIFGSLTIIYNILKVIAKVNKYFCLCAGDGPWDMMEQFDDRIPHRQFDNFQFVNFHKIVTSKSSYKNPSAAFALQALMEIPDQFVALRKLGMIG